MKMEEDSAAVPLQNNIEGKKPIGAQQATAIRRPKGRRNEQIYKHGHRRATDGLGHTENRQATPWLTERIFPRS